MAFTRGLYGGLIIVPLVFCTVSVLKQQSLDNLPHNFLRQKVMHYIYGDNPDLIERVLREWYVLSVVVSQYREVDKTIIDEAHKQIIDAIGLEDQPYIAKWAQTLKSKFDIKTLGKLFKQDLNLLLGREENKMRGVVPTIVTAFALSQAGCTSTLTRNKIAQINALMKTTDSVDEKTDKVSDSYKKEMNCIRGLAVIAANKNLANKDVCAEAAQKIVDGLGGDEVFLKKFGDVVEGPKDKLIDKLGTSLKDYHKTNETLLPQIASETDILVKNVALVKGIVEGEHIEQVKNEDGILTKFSNVTKHLSILAAIIGFGVFVFRFFPFK